jgi:ABC-type multidrug transport system permease subunit
LDPHLLQANLGFAEWRSISSILPSCFSWHMCALCSSGLQVGHVFSSLMMISLAVVSGHLPSYQNLWACAKMLVISSAAKESLLPGGGLSRLRK